MGIKTFFIWGGIVWSCSSLLLSEGAWSLTERERYMQARSSGFSDPEEDLEKAGKIVEQMRAILENAASIQEPLSKKLANVGMRCVKGFSDDYSEREALAKLAAKAHKAVVDAQAKAGSTLTSSQLGTVMACTASKALENDLRAKALAVVANNSQLKSLGRKLEQLGQQVMKKYNASDLQSAGRINQKDAQCANRSNSEYVEVSRDATSTYCPLTHNALAEARSECSGYGSALRAVTNSINSFQSMQASLNRMADNVAAVGCKP